MITVICNIYINSEEKLKLLKETFPLVYEVSDNWLVYIRGKFRKEALEFIKKNDSDKNNCIFFENLYNNSWAKSTQKMLKKSKYDYVYVFLEDHFLLKSIDHFRDVILDMIDSRIEYFSYSFFNIGLSVQSAEGLCPDYSKYFFSFQFDEKNIGYLKNNNSHFYPYSLASISTKKYFQKLLMIENKFLMKVSIFIQTIMENFFFFYPKNRTFWFNINKFTSKLGIRFAIYPPETPFNLEKSLFDCDLELLPLRVGGLKEELFANWDDDNGLSNSSLVKRGLYPDRLKTDTKAVSFDATIQKEYSLAKGFVESKQFYPEMNRVSDIPFKRLSVKSGVMKVFSEKESYTLKEGEDITIHANIPHHIEALEDLLYLAEILWKY